MSKDHGKATRKLGRAASRGLVGGVLVYGLAACSSAPHHTSSAPALDLTPQLYSQQYLPPGPPGDPWGPYIQEASTRFTVPDRWIREVMRQESGGQQYINGRLTVSSAGAIGLMQLMPATYDTLRQRYNLGPDPYYPKDNILAGTAYIRTLYDHYGAPGFLAAYNAGPGRLEAFLYNGRPLPQETVNYLASISPRLGSNPPLTGPLAVYAMGRSNYSTDALNRRALADARAAQTNYAQSNYGKTNPAALPNMAQPQTLAEQPAPIDDGDAETAALNRQALAGLLTPPPLPARRAMLPASEPAYQPPPMASIAMLTPPMPPDLPSTRRAAAAGNWGIQVGAFASQAQAHAAANLARQRAGDLLIAAQIDIRAASRSDGAILYRARLVGVTAEAASGACDRLSHQQAACMVVQRDGQA